MDHDWQGLRASRNRHPSGARWQPDRHRLAGRVMEMVAAGGAPWPDVAAAALAARGASGLGPTCFAAALGMSTAELADVEAGSRAPADLPSGLASRQLFVGTLAALRCRRLVPDPERARRS